MRDWITAETALPLDMTVSDREPAARIAELQHAVEGVIRGKSETVKLALVTLLARGHLLIEDVPGIGKTTLANALSRAVELSFQRVQFTSDLLPSDVVGISIYDQKNSEFEWRPGPIFSNIVLADEINRATPKTQSALLEAMAEEQVTVEGVTRRLPAPFMVIATQNPSEYHGTYPLPESQLDRFMIRLQMGYPAVADEREMLRDREGGDPLAGISAVMTQADIVELQEMASRVRVDDALVDYLLQITDLTRKADAIELGISPRGTLSLFRAAQALALVEGRNYCIADDIKRLIVPAYAHRMIVNSRVNALRQRTREAEQVLSDILQNVAVPL